MSLPKLWRIEPQGSPQPAGDAFPDLKTMQTAVGGYVEHVGLTLNNTELHLFANEDGLGLELPINQTATMLFRLACGWGRQIERDPNVIYAGPPGYFEPDGLYIVGTVLLWMGPLPEEETT